jgi:hypothetical protein
MQQKYQLAAAQVTGWNTGSRYQFSFCCVTKLVLASNLHTTPLNFQSFLDSGIVCEGSQTMSSVNKCGNRGWQDCHVWTFVRIPYFSWALKLYKSSFEQWLGLFILLCNLGKLFTLHVSLKWWNAITNPYLSKKISGRIEEHSIFHCIIWLWTDATSFFCSDHSHIQESMTKIWNTTIWMESGEYWNGL